ncbi:MAG: 23S rRNA (cytidine1920-2'-O)/16S rRNA (cytidine1409-2'-O)-methyltransferase [Hyphomicrobiaceae bacterium]|jgi:23S rRNA (cytidine1920-2'-O)/16S rRNA (cytidine1409-2'-O)-methyltransferase
MKGGRSGERADVLLVRCGAVADTDTAQRLILAGKVYAGTERVDKAGDRFPASTRLEVRGLKRFVSRGGLKLEQALNDFSIDVSDRVCVDAGASSGGFTDCLLRRGASVVYAVDVGYGQLAWELRSDDRVRVMERTNIRSIEREALDPQPTLVVADLSFCSLRTVVRHLVELAGAGGDLVVLVKPQFEVDGEDAPGGVVVEESVRRSAIAGVTTAAEACGASVIAETVSPITGAEGNIEFLLHLRS